MVSKDGATIRAHAARLRRATLLTPAAVLRVRSWDEIPMYTRFSQIESLGRDPHVANTILIEIVKVTFEHIWKRLSIMAMKDGALTQNVWLCISIQDVFVRPQAPDSLIRPNIFVLRDKCVADSVMRDSAKSIQRSVATRIDQSTHSAIVEHSGSYAVSYSSFKTKESYRIYLFPCVEGVRWLHPIRSPDW